MPQKKRIIMAFVIFFCWFFGIASLAFWLIRDSNPILLLFVSMLLFILGTILTARYQKEYQRARLKRLLRKWKKLGSGPALKIRGGESSGSTEKL